MHVDNERKSTSEFSEEELLRGDYGEEVFGSISDSYERDFKEAREYAADKRFAPAGPRPPVPPVGGQSTLNDDADTIKISSSCLQSFTYINSKQNISKVISNDDSSQTVNFKPCSKTSSSNSPTLFTNLQTSSSHSSP
jgi:hypothetical protein